MVRFRDPRGHAPLRNKWLKSSLGLTQSAEVYLQIEGDYDFRGSMYTSAGGIFRSYDGIDLAR